MTETLLSTAPTPIPLSLGGHTFHMVPVQAGEFDMGDEVGDLWDACRPVHRVRLDGFYIGQFPVTQALWKAVMDGENPSYFKGDTRPAERVSWEDIDKNFLPELNKRLPGWNFRLPTEAEWEYAARGGGTLFAGGNRLETVGWWDGNSHGETKPVGLKLPNALGLFDMSGNVWEWCDDWFDEKFYEKCLKKGMDLNPRNVEEGSFRVLRGGSWVSLSGGCRVAGRGTVNPEGRYFTGGFRLAAWPSGSVAGP
jgi:sulfatase modifying factor 1